MKKILLIGAVAALGFVAATPARAGTVVLTVSSYDMLNGDGTEVYGKYNYWDGNYSGSGNATTSRSPLSGGTGVLTDSVFATQRWDFVSNISGTGQYVGWKYFDPTITFHLSTLSLVYSINFFVDGSYMGLVGAPETISVNGQLYTPAVIPLNNMGVQLLIVPLAQPVWMSTAIIQLHAGPFGPDAIQYNLDWPGGPIPGDREPWMMLSEVQFRGVSAVPELSTWGMLLLGFLAVGFVGYRRRAQVVAAL